MGLGASGINLEHMLTHMVHLHNKIIDIVCLLKDAGTDYRDLCDLRQEPDSKYKDRLQWLMQEFDKLHSQVRGANGCLQDAILECGWKVEYDKDCAENIITGPCWDLEKEAE